MLKINARVKRNVGAAEFGEFLERIKALKGQAHGVGVGITASSGEPAHPGRDADGKSILEIAEANEFGLGGIPQRSFIRGWFDTFEGKARAQMKAILTKVVVNERGPVTLALERMGGRFVGECQKNIVNGGNPPFLANSYSTIQKKGSSSPLIDTGALKGAITYLVDPPRDA